MTPHQVIPLAKFVAKTILPLVSTHIYLPYKISRNVSSHKILISLYLKQNALLPLSFNA